MRHQATPVPGGRHPRRVYVRRRMGLGVLLFALVLVTFGVWLGLGLKHSASAIQADASAAQASIESAKARLEAGDYVQAAAAASTARAQVAAAAREAESVQVRIVGHLPVVGQAVTDLDNLIGAAADLADASSRVVDVYGAATGKSRTGPELFSGGKVDFAALASTSAAVRSALVDVEQARSKLTAVQGTLPGTHSMAAARDKALAQLDPLAGTLTTMRTVLDRMPSALGKGGSKSYLLVTLNPAELYPGGGAALGAALIRFTDGRLSVPIKGAVSTKLFPANPRVRWKHIVNMPYYDPGHGAAFAFSDLYPDYTVTAVEMERSWVANGEKPVDGVIALDPTALSAALRVTGPITSPAYGQVTADNLVQKLLVDAYADFRTNQDARHALNEELMNAVFARLTGGSGALSLIKALASTAPGHHFRVHVDDPVLQKTALQAGLAGEFPADPGDLLAVFTENQNGSKVDIFQKRAVTHEVNVRPDGSASVVTIMRITNAVPPSGRRSSDRIGYLTDWSNNYFLAHLPTGATGIRVTAPRTDPQDLDDPKVYPDLQGRSIVRIRRWTAAGGTTTVTFRYSLPAGTFGNGSALLYRLTTMPQPLTLDATLNLVVRGPGTASVVGGASGWTVSEGVARWSGPFTQVASTSVQWR